MQTIIMLIRKVVTDLYHASFLHCIWAFINNDAGKIVSKKGWEQLNNNTK